jgi:hypothetical protein
MSIAEYDKRCAAFRDFQDLTGEILEQEKAITCLTPLAFPTLSLEGLLPQRPGSGSELKEDPFCEAEGRTVMFTFEAPEDAHVLIAGDFTSWNSVSLEPWAANGKQLWRKAFFLKPGSYAYKYLINGQWLPDPANSETVSDNFGGANSLIEV